MLTEEEQPDPSTMCQLLCSCHCGCKRPRTGLQFSSEQRLDSLKHRRCLCAPVRRTLRAAHQPATVYSGWVYQITDCCDLKLCSHSFDWEGHGPLSATMHLNS